MPLGRLGPSMPGVSLLICAAFVGLALSCQQVIGADDVHFVVADAASAPPPGNWTCLGEKSDAGVPSTIKLTFNAFYLAAPNLPTTGLLFKVCNRNDLNCGKPLVSAVLGDDGETHRITMEVPTIDADGFRGYVEITDPNPEPKSIPYLYYFSRPLIEDFSINVFYVVSPSELVDNIRGATNIVDAVPDPLRGHFSAHAVDCKLQYADGISYSLVPESAMDGEVVRWFLQNSFPVGGAIQSEAASNALGGFFNLKPGFATIEARQHATGRVVAKTVVYIRPGALSTLTMVPNQ